MGTRSETKVRFSVLAHFDRPLSGDLDTHTKRPLLAPSDFSAKVRAWTLLKECWRDAAVPSRVHRKIGWHLDRWTAARIRVSEIWEHQPAITGKQVIETTGIEHSLRKIWVQRILRDCWLAAGRRKHVGLRPYNTVRARKRARLAT